VAAAVDDLRRRLGGLPSPAEAGEIWRAIWVHEAHNSTAIEGNTLVLREVERLLDEGQAIGSKQLKDYLEVRGYATAAEWVYQQALTHDGWRDEGLLTTTEVRHVHRLAMQPVWDVAPHPLAASDEGPGSWRSHDIEPFPSGMTPPGAWQVDAEMRGWVDRVRAFPAEDRPPLEEVARRHAEFERIHPFIDGNGRTGRLLLNLTLTRLGYPPAIIFKRERPRYLNALRREDSGDTGALGELIARAVLDNLYRFVVPAVAGPVRLVPLAALATPKLSAVALRAAAERGRLKAQRNARGDWLSSRAWVAHYMASRYRRRGAADAGPAHPVGASRPRRTRWR